MMKRLFYILAVALLPVMAQAKVVTGQVTDQNGEPIIGANVVVKGTTAGTITDLDGNYSLDVPENATLVFSYLGMATQEIPVTGNTVSVVLKEDNQVLEEVVVTGYGTTKKRDLVTSVSSVNADQLKDVPVASAAEALQGKMAGVSVTTTEGSPDADVKIRVRGGTSLTQSSDPLYIVDGFQVSSISDIPPTNIQSMDVLKDAAATAIYGAQGANGVIIITTKDADNNADDKMQIHFDYTGYVGWKQMAKKYEMLDVDNFVLMQYEYAHYRAKGNTANIPSNFNEYFDQRYSETQDKSQVMTIPEIQKYWRGQKVTDWQEETFGNHGLNSNHSFTVSGGNKTANFSLTYNRVDDEGIMYGSDYDRNHLNFKTNFKPIKGLTISFTARYTNTVVLGAGTNTAQDAGSKTESRVRNAIAYSPIELFAKDNVAGLDDYESFGSLYDPITTIDHNYRKKTDNKYNLQGYVSYKFAKWFTFKSELGYEGRSQSQDRYYGPTTYYSRAGDGFTYAEGAGYGHIIATEQKNSRFKNYNTLEFKNKWGDDHDLDILIGEELQMMKGELRTTNGYGYDASIKGQDVFNYVGSAKAYTAKSYVDPTDNMLSFFASANYILYNRYYFRASFRADASTRFAKGNQWGYFPSVAVAWRIIDEPWMEPAQDVMSNFKLRLDYGLVGNNNVDLGYLRPEYLASSTAYNGLFDTKLTDGGADVIAANNNLKWETTATSDFGIDFGFFNERLTGTIDLYWNTTKDLIIRQNMPARYNYQYQNIGSTRNMGMEFSIKGIILDKKSKSLSYNLSVDANISFNKTRVEDLGNMTKMLAQTSCFGSSEYLTTAEFLLEVGQPVGNVLGYETDGYYTATDFQSYATSTHSWGLAAGVPNYGDGFLSNKPVPGSIKFKDQNGDGVIDEKDKVILGNTVPTHSGGFNINFNIGGDKWGKFDLAANFTFAFGNQILNLSKMEYTTVTEKTKMRNLITDMSFNNRYSLYSNQGQYMPDYYATSALMFGDAYTAFAQQIDQFNIDKGANTYSPIMSHYLVTDQCMEDGSFLRLNQLTLGYSLPKVWMEKTKVISNIRVYVQGTNLFCATKYSGLDPEVDTRSSKNPLTPGVDFSAYPKSRGINVGLNIQF